MKKLTDNEKIDLSCEVTNTLAKQKRVEHYDVIAQSYGKTRLFDLKDDDLRKTHIEYVRTHPSDTTGLIPSQTDVTYLKLLDELVRKAEHSSVREDRTGTGTVSIFGHQMRFDLSKQFPILSTKKVYFKGVVAELLWFLRGDTSTDYLNEHNCHIWNPNTKSAIAKNPARFLGHNLGNMYGMAWRYLPCNPHGLVKLKRKTYIKKDFKESHIKPEMTKVYTTPKVIKTTHSGVMHVLGKVENKFVVHFLNTGSYRLVNSVYKSTKDLFAPSVESVGYLGKEIDFSNPTVKSLHRVWQDILIRVYNPRKNHASYSDVTIADEWLNFSRFMHDCFSLWGFQEYVDSGYQWQLDKDYLGARVYSKDTCIFISKALNTSINSGGNVPRVYEFDNTIFYSREALQNYRGKTRQANLPKECIIYEDSSEYVYRPIIWVDQLSNAINLIKTNPTSRRIVVDSWNPRNEDNACLSTCHPMFQFYVEDGKLSCQLYQRKN